MPFYSSFALGDLWNNFKLLKNLKRSTRPRNKTPIHTNTIVKIFSLNQKFIMKYLEKHQVSELSAGREGEKMGERNASSSSLKIYIPSSIRPSFDHETRVSHRSNPLAGVNSGHHQWTIINRLNRKSVGRSIYPQRVRERERCPVISCIVIRCTKKSIKSILSWERGRRNKDEKDMDR